MWTEGRLVYVLADRTNGRAIGTVLRLSSSSSSVRNVLWLNGASWSKYDTIRRRV